LNTVVAAVIKRPVSYKCVICIDFKSWASWRPWRPHEPPGNAYLVVRKVGVTREQPKGFAGRILKE